MNWYDHRKLLGSMAVPEMRASTIAARALSLEPRYTRVPCVGGTEGEALVPLFSRAVDYFEFPPVTTFILKDETCLVHINKVLVWIITKQSR